MKVAVAAPVMYNFEGYTRLMRSLQGKEFTPYVQNNYDTNIGVAAAWNLFLEWAVNDNIDMLFIVNDDVTFEEGSYDRAVEAWETRRPEDCIVMTCHCSYAEDQFYPGMADFCCFALDPKRAIQEIGYFDHENFTPAYYEDNDYMRRIKLAGFEYYLYGGLKVHHEGSKTQFWNGEENRVVGHDAFRANQERYVRKWGGLPGNEFFTTPFNKE